MMASLFGFSYTRLVHGRRRTDGGQGMVAADSVVCSVLLYSLVGAGEEANKVSIGPSHTATKRYNRLAHGPKKNIHSSIGEKEKKSAMALLLYRQKASKQVGVRLGASS